MVSRIASGVVRKTLCMFMAVLLAWGLNPAAVFADELVGDDVARAGGAPNGEQWTGDSGSGAASGEAAASEDALDAAADAAVPAEEAAISGDADASVNDAVPFQADGVAADEEDGEPAAGSASEESSVSSDSYCQEGLGEGPATDSAPEDPSEPSGADGQEGVDGTEDETGELGRTSRVGDIGLFDPLTDAHVGTLAETYGGHPLVVIVGASDDESTRVAFEGVARIAASGQQSDVRFALLDAAGTGRDFASWAPESAGDGVAAYSHAGSGAYAQWASDLFAECGGSPDAVVYPFVFAFDEAGCVVMYGSGAVDLVALLEDAYGIVAFDDDADVTGEIAQELAPSDAEAPDGGSAEQAEQGESPASDGLDDDAPGAIGTDGAGEAPIGTPAERSSTMSPSDGDPDDEELFAQASVWSLALYNAANGNLAGMFATSYAGKKTVVIVGSAQDGSTQTAVAEAYQMTQNELYNDVYFVVLDYDGTGTAFANAFGEYANSHLKLYSKSGSSSYRDFAWDQYEESTGSSSPVSLPFVFAYKTPTTLLDCSAGLDRFPKLVSEAYGIDDPTYHTYNVEVTGLSQQTEARRLLDLVNAARQEEGATPLVWDTDLEQTAMQRAAELVLLFSHTRPDGSSCFTAWPAGYQCARENIAAGPCDADGVNASWTESPGHYANMIATDVTTFAAALVVVPGSYYEYYWVECFSTGDGTGLDTVAFDGENAFSVSVVEPSASALSLYFDGADISGATIPTADNPLYVGSSLDLVAYMSVEGRRFPADLTELTWTSSDTSIAQVSETGCVSGVFPGSATITAALPDGALSVSCTVRVTGIIEESGVTPPEDRTYNRRQQMPEPTVTYGGKTLVEDVDYTLAYEDNVNAGTATVIITGRGYYMGQVTTHFQIARAGKSGNTFLAWRPVVYTGHPNEPGFDVVVAGEPLHKDLDYTVECSNNVNAGYGYYTITLIRNYVGVFSGSFQINPADIGESTVVAAQESYPYTGEPIEPPVTVTWGEMTLAQGSDYTVEYADNTQLGTATVTVTGQGNFEGTAEATFQIVPIDIAGAQITIPSQTYDGSALEPAAHVMVGGKTLQAGIDYAIEYAGNTDAGTATATVTGQGFYTGTAGATFKINPLRIGSGASAASSFTATLASDHVYFKDNTEPAVTLKRDGVALTKGTDFTVAYSGGVVKPDQGVSSAPATATVSGKGNYTGAIVLPYEVYCRTVHKNVMGSGTIELRSSTLYPKGGDTVVFRTIPAQGQTLEKFNVTYTDPTTGEGVKLNVPNGVTRTKGTGLPGTISEYSFTMPDCDVDINVTFKENPTRYLIRKNMSGPGAATSNLQLVGSDGKSEKATSDAVKPTMTPKAGQTMYFKIVPGKGYKLTKFNVTYSYVDINGVQRSALLVTGAGITSHGGGLYSFTMPNYSVTLTGVFEKK